MFFTIRNKILFLFILISIIPLALFAVLGGYFINLAQSYSVAQLESQFIGQKEKEIEKFFPMSVHYLTYKLLCLLLRLAVCRRTSENFYLKK